MRLLLLVSVFLSSAIAFAADRQINQISVEQSDSDTIIRLYGSGLIRSQKDRLFFAAEASSYSLEPMMMYGDEDYVEVALAMKVAAGQYRISIGPNENTATLQSMVVIGAIGPRGEQGPAGRDGVDGRDGADGLEGAQGPKGEVGPRGEQGPEGPAGPQGEIGPAGADGAQGPQGPIGPIGLTGAPGERGEKGDAFIGDIPNGNLAVGDGQQDVAPSQDSGSPEGRYNTSVGVGAMSSVTGGYDNVAVGFRALNSTSMGDANIAVGLHALEKNTTGSRNVAVGASALTSFVEGRANIGIGTFSLGTLQTGEDNTAVGNQSLLFTTSGLGNTAVGSGTLETNISGSDNVALGKGADVAFPSLSNAIAIGTKSVVDSSNKIQLGNAAIESVATAGALTTGQVTYPNTDGSEGQILVTNGQGELFWATPATLGADGSSCSVTQADSGAMLTCTDGTSASLLNGNDGLDGAQGLQGPIGLPGATGPQGPAGPQGLAGERGSPGLSCSVSQVANTAEIQCGDGSSAILAGAGTTVVLPSGIISSDAINYLAGDIIIEGADGTIIGPLTGSLFNNCYKSSLSDHLDEFEQVSGGGTVKVCNISSLREVRIAPEEYPLVYFQDENCSGQPWLIVPNNRRVRYPVYMPNRQQWYVHEGINLRTILARSYSSTLGSQSQSCYRVEQAYNNASLLVDFEIPEQVLGAEYPASARQLP